MIQARAGVFTRANTLFLAGVSSRVDWTADLAERGKRTGRFRLDYFLSASFNQSDPSGSAWLGNPQAVSPCNGLPCLLLWLLCGS